MDAITESIRIGTSAEARVPLGDSTTHRSVLCLCGCMRHDAAADLGLDRIDVFALVDGDGNDPALFSRTVATLAELERRHAPVLVHCHAGRSRSVAVVAAHLAMARGIELDDALSHIARYRATALHPALYRLAQRIVAERS